MDDNQEINIRIAMVMGHTVYFTNITSRDPDDVDLKLKDGSTMPNWSGDLNRAVELCSGTMQWCIGTTNVGGNNFFAEVRKQILSPLHQVIAETPAKALCLAWLEAMEEK